MVFIDMLMPGKSMPPVGGIYLEWHRENRGRVFCSGLVVVSNYGKGRVVEMAYWAGYGTKSNADFCGLIPHMNRQEVDLAPPGTDV